MKRRDTRELDKVEKYLADKGVMFLRSDTDAEKFDRHQIEVYENGEVVWSVICHFGSYGCNEGLLEGMGYIFRADVEGWLTADDVIQRIEAANRNFVIKDGKIVEATRDELYKYWVKRYDMIFSFTEFVQKCKELGMVVREDGASCGD